MRCSSWWWFRCWSPSSTGCWRHWNASGVPRTRFSAGGVALIGEVDRVPELLAVTDQTIEDVSTGAVRYAGSVAKLLG